MRKLIADLYKILLKGTGSRGFALIVAIIYVSALNYITLYGMILLLKGVFGFLSYTLVLFKFPYYFALCIALPAFNFWLMLPLDKLEEEEGIKANTGAIVIYTISCALLLAYSLLNI